MMMMLAIWVTAPILCLAVSYLRYREQQKDAWIDEVLSEIIEEAKSEYMI